MKKFLKKILNFLGYNLTKSNPNLDSIHKKLSFSQCGEDLIIDYIFKLRGISYPSYIDIGANHPHHISNTALFYAKGCKGINIEANSDLLAEFDIHRPNDINLNIGIGDKEEDLTFYIMEDSTLSTFSYSEMNFLRKNGNPLKKEVNVKLRTLSYILSKYCNNTFPDLLSIDVEGLDEGIIKSIDFKQSVPKIICVESAEYSPIGAGKRRSELIDFLNNQNYYEYANTNLNAIMIHKDFWFVNG